MKTASLFALLLALSLARCDCPADPLVGYCDDGAACWTDPIDGQIRTDQAPFWHERGTCTLGRLQCDGADVVACAGEVFEEPEICNGLDDDCDGRTDDDLFQYPGDPENACSERGECGRAYQRCVGGALTCEYPSNPRPEECDCLDNDCDLQTDEGLDVPTYFYPGDPATVGVGACRPGVVSACKACQQTTIPPVTPVTEVCGNDIDDDCDGFTDEPDEDVPPRAFVLVIDVSGSMIENLGPLTTAVCTWADDFAFDGSVFAVVLVGSGEASPFVDLRQGFEDSATTCATMQGPPALDSDAYGTEYMLEGCGVGMELPWPAEVAPEDRHLIVFADEPMYYYTLTEVDVALGCDALDASLDAFVPTDRFADWDALADACGGYVSNLDDGPALVGALRARFAGGC